MRDEFDHRDAAKAELRRRYMGQHTRFDSDLDIRCGVLRVVAHRVIRPRAHAMAEICVSYDQMEDAGGRDSAVVAVSGDLIDLLNVHQARFDRALKYTSTGKQRAP